MHLCIWQAERYHAPMRIHARDVCRALHGVRFPLRPERLTQEKILARLRQHYPFHLFEDEKKVGNLRLDIFVTGLCIEIKANRAVPKQVREQLERYAALPEVLEILLITNRAVAVPEELNGKPVFTFSLGAAWI